jgi:hypothetical protein
MDYNYIIEYIKTKEFNYLLTEFYKSIIIYYIVLIFGKLFWHILKIIYKFINFIYNLITKIMNYNTKFDNLNDDIKLDKLNDDIKFCISNNIDNPEDYINLKKTSKSFNNVMNEKKIDYNILKLEYIIEFKPNDITYIETISKKFSKKNRLSNKSIFFDEILTDYKIISNGIILEDLSADSDSDFDYTNYTNNSVNQRYFILITHFTNNVEKSKKIYDNLFLSLKIKKNKIERSRIHYTYYFDSSLFDNNLDYWKKNNKNYVFLKKKGLVDIQSVIKELNIKKYIDFKLFLYNNYDFEFKVKTIKPFYIKKDDLIYSINKQNLKNREYLKSVINFTNELQDNIADYINLPAKYDKRFINDMNSILQNVQANIKRMNNYIITINNTSS